MTDEVYIKIGCSYCGEYARLKSFELWYYTHTGRLFLDFSTSLEGWVFDGGLACPNCKEKENDTITSPEMR